MHSRLRRQLLAAPLAASAVGGLAACTFSPDHNHQGPDAPRAEALRTTPGTAWVFSSGGPRGFVHVGVLQALEELGLGPDLIVGASAGALVGVLCASGFSGAQLRELAMDVQPWSFARLAFGAEERLSPLAIADWLRSQVSQRQLQALPIPVACVAFRPALRDVVAYNAGDSGLAVAASCAIQGQFSPVRIRGAQHVDADLHQPMPVRVARALGAKRVIAVDASAHLDRAPSGTERYRKTDEAKAALTALDAQVADLVIKPDFGYWVSLSKEFRARAMDAGYRETMRQAAVLRSLHAGR